MADVASARQDLRHQGVQSGETYSEDVVGRQGPEEGDERATAADRKLHNTISCIVCDERFTFDGSAGQQETEQRTATAPFVLLTKNVGTSAITWAAMVAREA